MRFDHITLDDGLSQSNVLSILQDSRGLMWIGTENGLNSYNGYEFEYFRRDRGNPDALGSGFIFDIDEDRNGNLWIATNGGGLAMFDVRSGRFKTFRHDPENTNSISSNVVRRVLVDKKGIVWIGTRGAGLDRLNPGSGEINRYHFGADEDVPDNIYALLQNTAGVMWVGGDHGLTRLDTNSGNVITFVHDPSDSGSLSANGVRAIETDADGNLWVGTNGGGLNRLLAGAQSFDHFVNDPDDKRTISSDRVSAVVEDSDGRLWVGTTSGLNLVDRASGTFVRYEKDSANNTSLGDNNITAIYEDRSGLLWIGTKTQGINKWDPRTWSYGLENPQENIDGTETQPNVTSFVEDDAGTLWVGTFGDGLNAMNRTTGEVVNYRNDPGSDFRISDDSVMSLMRDRDGKIWVGTMNRGINRIDPKAGSSETLSHDPENPNSLSANGIMALYEDQAGLVWVGTFGGGISRFDPATKIFTRFRADANNINSLSSDRVTSFAEDPSGRMWIGTDSGGLNLFDPVTEKFYRFRHDPDDSATLAADTVYSINVDKSGTVWVGTHGGGLDRVVGDVSKSPSIHFENLSVDDGLPNDVIYGAQFDNAGLMWLSTNYGISKYDPDTGEINNLHRKDGLQSEEFNFGAHYRSSTGELFFGGHNGFNAFHPDEIEVSKVVPLIALTGFFNNNDSIKSDLPVDDHDGIEISWKDNTVAFEFAALDYALPSENRYMYKLEGFDREWIDLGNRRRVTYTDLNDGHYLLRVRAANSAGIWNEAGYTLPVKVTAAPWDTWWAYLGYIALFAQLVAFLWLGHHRKMRREEAYSHRLEQEVEQRTEKLLDKNQQLRDLNQALQESSLSDPLTGLRNRRFVFEEVSRDLKIIQRKLSEERDGLDASATSDLVFMMIDLDHFKPINDTFGHAAGDQMLLEFRDVLLSICRRSDFVIRWGGDEFVVIAKQARQSETEALAERIRSTVADHDFTLGDGQIVRTTCSIGFAAYPLFRNSPDDSDLDQIINLADSLMYEAKKTRNAWAGMMTPTEASTSSNFQLDTIEPTSLLFRARRAGMLTIYESDERNGEQQQRMNIAG
jgi:diguanylate cyclase (GGDEF)-like protein